MTYQWFYDVPIDGKNIKKHTGNFHNPVQEVIQIHISAHGPGCQK